MKTSITLSRIGTLLVRVAAGLLLALPLPARAAGWALVGWNNLGMHCMDEDFALFSLLPPYNTINAQLTDAQGNLVVNPAAQGITVTYVAIADPDGSINTTSAGKTNFWEHVQDLFGASVAVDDGLAGKSMPGATNVPQPMTFDAASGWFIAEGIPLTPYDDAGRKNYYPMMQLTARNISGAVLATTDIVLPVSDEMDCKSCHRSGAGPAAQPAAGWAFDADPKRDVRLNILRLHDERQAGDPTFQSTLAAAGYNPAGLFANAVTDGRSVLCANCHLSEALPGSGRPGVLPLTQAIHGLHAVVNDPTNGMSLDASDNRSACYRCHPGSVTRCLRGAMGAAVASDGTLAMQCQSCHGTMSEVASPARTSWLDEPACQSCHTGTAISNNGQIRYTSVFDSLGHPRVPVDRTYATNADTPAAGLSLYRFSAGHGGIKCEGCHGSTHAEFPASHRNDNIQSVQHQGHVGMLVECTTCHAQQPLTVSGGPHGMHPIGSAWIDAHPDAVQSGGAQQCRACHGADYRGTVLSRSKADRLLNTTFGAKYFWRGFQIGCYTCHRGPSSESANPNRPAVASDASVVTDVNTSVTVALGAADPDGNALMLRIVSQPVHGTVGLNGNLADYFPDPDFTGIDTFTFAAWDGSIDSNLATVAVTVGQGVATPTPTGSGVAPTPTPVPGAAVCPATPRGGCRTSGRATLFIRRDAEGSRDRMHLALNRGQSTLLAELGNPTASTSYAVCVYDSAGRPFAVSVPATGRCGDKPCWKASSGNGYVYSDGAATRDGISRVVLRARDADKTAALVWGKGNNLAVPPLPLQGTVTAQVINSAGWCMQATYPLSTFKKNDGTTFKATAIAP